MGGPALISRLAIDRVHACAPCDSLGGIITVNGAAGGFLAKAASGRVRGTSPQLATAPRARTSPDADDGGDADDEDDGSDEATRATTTPRADVPVAWACAIPEGDIRGIRAKVQSLPSRKGLRDALLQPAVHAINIFGPAARDDATLACGGYKFYACYHIAVWGRAKDSPRLTNETLRRRAARAAHGGLEEMWNERVAECGVNRGHGGAGNTISSATRKPRKPPPSTAAVGSMLPAHVADPVGTEEDDLSDADTDTEDGRDAPARREQATAEARMLAAQHWINTGNPGKALGCFSATSVGSPKDPALLRSLLDLTPWAELPSAHAMRDEPGTPAFTLKHGVCDKFIRSLPAGRAAGTMLTTYELIRSTYEAGAQAGWQAFFSAFTAGALVEALACLVCGVLRAVMLTKEKGWRPLGIKESECRCGAALFASQKKAGWNSWYTSELPEYKAARESRVRDTAARVEQLQAAVAGAATRNPTAARRARAALATANIEAEAARAPPNFPVQLCYAPNGADLGCHALEAFHCLMPDNTTVPCDTYNMYNETEREPAFDCMRTHDPESIPIYRMMYGRLVSIYVDRHSEGGTVQVNLRDVVGKADRLGLADSGLVDPDDPCGSLERSLINDELPAIYADVDRHASDVTDVIMLLYLCSSRGWHQGCALATNGACCSYHLALHHLAQDPRFRHTAVLCFGDDTYGNDDDSIIYEWRAAKIRTCTPLGHVARIDKEACWSPRSGCTHAPAELPGSPRHPDGLLPGFKALGAFFGHHEWCRERLANKLLTRLDHLDLIDGMRDSPAVTNSAQIQNALFDISSSSIPVYSMRVQHPSLFFEPLPPAAQIRYGAETAAAAVDARLATSFTALTAADDTPSDLRALALQQACLKAAHGGLGCRTVTSTAEVAYCASRIAVANRLHAWFPALAAFDPTTDEHPWFADVRDIYERTRTQLKDLHALHADLRKDELHCCDGSTVLQAHVPPKLPHLKSLPPFASINGTVSVSKNPSQGKLTSVIDHLAWFACKAAWQQWDDDHPGGPAPNRCVTNFIAMSQPGTDGWLRIKPSTHGARIESTAFLWQLQRRFNLHLSSAKDVFAASAAVGVPHDPWGDRLLGEPGTDKSAGHTEVLRVLYAAHQATAPGPVVYGDKENIDQYHSFNTGCCLDIGERGAAPGGQDLIVEIKGFSALASTVVTGCARRGATHGFGNTLERAIRKVRGVRARTGAHRWDHAKGTGSVIAAPGDYDDALTRRKSVVLFLMETSGGFSRPAKAHLRWLQSRSKRVDRTPYTGWEPAPKKGTRRPFMQHWMQHLSTAMICGDARRGLNALSAMAALHRL